MSDEPISDLGFARVDTDRATRTGDPEVVYGAGKTPAQVVIRWHLQTGNIVIPKSVTPSRIKDNIDVFNFTLDADDLRAIATLDRGGRIGPDPATMNWLG